MQYMITSTIYTNVILRGSQRVKMRKEKTQKYLSFLGLGRNIVISSGSRPHKNKQHAVVLREVIRRWRYGKGLEEL